MESHSEHYFDWTTAAMCVFVLEMAFICGVYVSGNHYRTELVKRGFAEYDAKTGEWKWKEQPQ